MIPREHESSALECMKSGKAVIVYGARQVGKTTMITHMLKDADDVLKLNGDSQVVQKLLHDVTANRWKQLIGSNRILYLDEAQRIKDVGLKLKLILDELPEISVVVSGSSSFELVNLVAEPLTGRKREFSLSPLSFREMVAHHGLLEERSNLLQRLVYGSYPEIVTHPNEAQENLMEIESSYLYRDLFRMSNIRKSDKFVTLLQALAYQIGSQVSYRELAQLCNIDKATVEKYLNALEKAFVIFRLPSFSGNMRNELKFSRKIYFVDNGIRNAVIGDLTPAELRSDIGAIWENYLVAERRKNILNSRSYAQSYFWRTAQQKEIDYIEKVDGVLSAYEFKWNPNAKASSTARFKEAYGVSDIPIITPENYQDFLLPDLASA